MIIHQLERPRELIYDYDDWTPCRLYDSDIDNLIRLGVEEIWYWYQSGSYEGSGQLLMRIGNKYALEDLGHCSCNGPTEFAVFTAFSFEELENSRTEGLKVYTDELFEAARPSLKPDWEI
jgi:hypothetical protein